MAGDDPRRRNHAGPRYRTVSTAGDALILQIPASGIDASWLARLLEDLGLAHGDQVRVADQATAMAPAS
jgi:hypothetical protein